MPLVVAAEATAAGRQVLAAAIHGITQPEIDQSAHEVIWLEWGDLPAFFQVLETWRERGVTEAIMAGKVEQQRIYSRAQDDGELEGVLAGLPSGHTDQLLGAVAKILDGAGIRLLESTRYLGSALAAPGPIAGREPDARELADIEHGWAVARSLGAVDIGQTVVVKERAVVAVEAMEGTDACIRRAGELAGAGTVVVKVGKPDQDLRFDVPVIGVQTLESMISARASVLAVQSGVTVIFDHREMQECATRAGIAVLARVHE